MELNMQLAKELHDALREASRYEGPCLAGTWEGLAAMHQARANVDRLTTHAMLRRLVGLDPMERLTAGALQGRKPDVQNFSGFFG